MIHWEVDIEKSFNFTSANGILNGIQQLNHALSCQIRPGFQSTSFMNHFCFKLYSLLFASEAILVSKLVFLPLLFSGKHAMVKKEVDLTSKLELSRQSFSLYQWSQLPASSLYILHHDNCYFLLKSSKLSIKMGSLTKLSGVSSH